MSRAKRGVSYQREVMPWSRESVLQFVEIYHSLDVLWDPKHPYHYDKEQKQEAWEDVAKQVGKSVEDCKRKMDYLLAALRREKMKMKKGIGKSKFVFNA